jgi:hypothetical protein
VEHKEKDKGSAPQNSANDNQKGNEQNAQNQNQQNRQQPKVSRKPKEGLPPKVGQ